MSEIHAEVAQLRHQLKVATFKNELNHLKSSDPDSHRIDLLKKLIDSSGTAKKVVKKTHNSHEGLFSEVDKLVYKRPWKSLSPIHKRIKMDEYIDSLPDMTTKQKILFKKTFSKAIEYKMLNKKNDVEYDTTEGKLVDVPTIRYDEENETYVCSLKVKSK